MKKKIGLLAAVVVLSTVSSIAYGWTNPLKSYNLYDDTHAVSDIDAMNGNAKPRANSDSYEHGMTDYYQNSVAGQNAAKSTSNSLDNIDMRPQTPTTPRRNEILRESSRKVYSTTPPVAGWTQGPSFYSHPTLASIKQKYHNSNFAGCMQECTSYVRLHPGDTLGFYYLAMCYAKVSDKDNAIKAYERVIALNSNPMIVKYATNGRNCVMGNSSEKCYQDVNVPDLIYPYAHVADGIDLTPIDPNTLINKNIVSLQSKLVPSDKDATNKNPNDPNAKNTAETLQLPFGDQDVKLDRFINAPYGNGLSPAVNSEYKQLQLKRIQETVNGGEDSPEKNFNDVNSIKTFDDKKSDLGTLTLAYNGESSEMDEFTKSPEYIQSKKELDQINILFGNNNSKETNESDEMTNLIMSSQNGKENVPPEVIQSMMMKSMMPDFTFVNNSKNLL